MEKIMKNIAMVLILFLTVFTAVSCDDDGLLEPHELDQPRVLAIKATPPEVKVGDMITFKLLMGGRNFDQENSELEVRWMGEIATPYNKGRSFPLTQEILDAAGEKGMSERDKEMFEKNGWFNFPVIADVGPMTFSDRNGKSITKSASSFKSFRLYSSKEPKHFNPVINSIRAHYLNDGFTKEESSDNDSLLPEEESPGEAILEVIGKADESGKVNTIVFEEGRIPEEVAFSPDITENGNDKLIYRWFYSVEKEGEKMLSMNSDSDIRQRLLGNDALFADQNHRDLILNLKEDGEFLYGIYNVYLILRDKTDDPTNKENDRFGVDFISFKLDIRKEEE